MRLFGLIFRMMKGKCLVLIFFYTVSQEITAIEPETIDYSNFNASKITRFITHGFIDQGEENWLSDMCKVWYNAIVLKSVHIQTGNAEHYHFTLLQRRCGDKLAAS